MWRRLLGSNLIGLAVLSMSTASLAQSPNAAAPPEIKAPNRGAVSTGSQKGLSNYERVTLEMALSKVGREIDPEPEGKIVEGFDIVTFEVFDKREQILQLLNVFHVTTLPRIIEREVLLRAGQPYRRDLADETARNLRELPQLSLVLAVPLRGSHVNAVRLMLITKDVWSLRLSWDLRLSSAGLDTLRLEPTETNLFGTHQSIAARYSFRPETHTFGTGFRVPRLQGERLSLGADANVVFNRASGEPEGSFGSTYLMRPLFSTRTKWSWFVANDWSEGRSRRYVDTRVAQFNARSTPERDALRDEYISQRFTEQVAVTRSFGFEHKQDVTLGAEFSRRAYRLPTEVLARYSDAVLDEYRRARMPVSDTRVGPMLRARFYENRFRRSIDFESLGLQEDYRVGYDFTLKGYPVIGDLGSTRTFLGTSAAAQYTWTVGDGVIRIGADVLNEFEQDRIADAAVGGDLRIHSPSLFGWGRLIFDATVANRYRNYLNRKSLLGGDTRLRGYPTAYFSGKDYVAANLEYRTPSFNIATVLLGAAAFYDVGDAFDGFDNMEPKQSAGAGVRILFPQLDRVVFRVDFAVPLTPQLPDGVSRYGGTLLGVPIPSFFAAFEQAFPFSTSGGSIAPAQGKFNGMLGQ